MATADAEPGALYDDIEPALPLGLPFVSTAVSEGWFDWPTLPELFPVSFSGVKTSRDGFLVDVDRDRLKARIADYFDAALSHEEIVRRYPGVMKTTARFDARKVRAALRARGGPVESGFVRFAYRPFDTRWLYWEKDTKLLDEKRAEYRPHVFKGNLWLSAAQHLRKDAEEPQVFFTGHMASGHLIERGASMFPAWLRDDGIDNDRNLPLPDTNTTASAVARWFRLIQAHRRTSTTRQRTSAVAPTCRAPPSAISSASASASKTCSTTFLPRFTIPRTAQPTPGHAHGVAAHPAARLAYSRERGHLARV